MSEDFTTLIVFLYTSMMIRGVNMDIGFLIKWFLLPQIIMVLTCILEVS